MPSSAKKAQPSAKSVAKLKVEPPYSTGDCGYQAIIIGLLYLSLKAADSKVDSLESKVINAVLQKKPNGISQWLVRANLIKDNATNAEILRAFVSGLNKKFMFNLTEVFEELIPKLKLASANSEWLHHLVKETLTSGIWDAYDIENLTSIKALESKVNWIITELPESKDFMSFEDIDVLKIQARSQLISSLPEKQLKSIIDDVINHVFLKESMWLDMFYLKKLTEQLLGGENILFDGDGVNINSKGPLDCHWYIDLPEDQYSRCLLEACKNQMRIVAAPALFISKDQTFDLEAKSCHF